MFQILKNTAAAAAKSPAFDRFVKLLEDSDGRQPGLLRVLTYHRIDNPARRPWLDPGLISATPEDFEEQMTYLAAHYQVVTISDLLAALGSGDGKHLPPRAVLVTFDDGYCDFEEQAWPVLTRHKVPAALFVPTAYPDHPERTFWWDDLYQALRISSRQTELHTPVGAFSLSDAVSRDQIYQRLKIHIKTLDHADAISTVRELCRELGVPPGVNSIMSWDSLRKLARAGLTLGAHTRTHPLLNRIPLEQSRQEMSGSLEDLGREIGDILPIFAYPGGELNKEVVDMLGREGFSLAFTTERGINSMNHLHPLRIKRINVGRRTSLPILRTQLLSWTVHLNRPQGRFDA